MSKLFKLKPIKRFRKIRIKACGNCKYLHSLDGGMILACARTHRGKISPHWIHNCRTDPQEVYGQTWQHVCDRWVRKDQ